MCRNPWQRRIGLGLVRLHYCAEYIEGCPQHLKLHKYAILFRKYVHLICTN